MDANNTKDAAVAAQGASLAVAKHLAQFAEASSEDAMSDVHAAELASEAARAAQETVAALLDGL